MSLDLVVRGGLVVDGSGASALHADVGVQGGVITQIGRIDERGRQEIDAEGRLVTPGFIDGHTHFDAQINWDPLLTGASWHGVTTAVMGNCGFTIAPCRPNEHALVVRNLERAEDISAAAMEIAINWTWESFPQYLDVVDGLPKGINLAVYLGHSALRTWAMGECAFERAAAPDETQQMEQAVRDAMAAGAIGFSTSRSPQHETSDNRPVASRLASWEEVCRLVGAMGESGRGVFELATEPRTADPEQRAESYARMSALAVASKRPLTFGLTPATAGSATVVGEWLQMVDTTAAKGGLIVGQTNSRDASLVLSFKTQLPFDNLPEWKEFRSRPLAEQKRRLADPRLRERLVRIANEGPYPRAVSGEARKPKWDRIFIYDRPLPPFRLLSEAAAQKGVDPVTLMIDLSLEKDFDCYFLQFLAPYDEALLLKTLEHRDTVMTFSDSGAHVGQISDCSIQTYLLAYWVRERRAIALEEAVRLITSGPARIFGIGDRGMLRAGMAADINVIDLERLNPHLPDVAHDIPGGARRLVQGCTGIDATIVAGEVMMLAGKHTGALPGRLLRGGR